MRMDRVWTIARKDIASARKHRYVLYGLIGIPLIFAVLIPLSMLYPVLLGEQITENDLPSFAVPGLEPKQAMALGLVQMSVLMFMLLPAIIPSVISSYTFVGEKVNRQLEPLLATPTTDAELLVGKLMGAFVPAMLSTLISFAGFVVIVDALTFPLFGRLLLPDWISLVVLLVFCPLVGLAATSFCVVISAKVSDVRAAMQLGALSVLPPMGFYFLFTAGIVRLNWLSIVIFGALLACLSVGLLALGRARFGREEILVRWR